MAVFFKKHHWKLVKYKIIILNVCQSFEILVDLFFLLADECTLSDCEMIHISGIICICSSSTNKTCIQMA